MNQSHYVALVMGASAGGMEAIGEIISPLPKDFPLPILIAQHVHPSDQGGFARHLGRATALTVVEPCDKDPIRAGFIYVAPANYHMLVERQGLIALSIDEKVNWSRPSIDVLFESAAYAWGERLIAVILSGANNDGAKGMRVIRDLGGLTIAQTLESAEVAVMPQAAIDTGAIEKVLELEQISKLLIQLGADAARALNAVSEIEQ